MPEKNIGEHQVEKPSLRFTLNFLGTMPGYGHEYRLTVESGASAKDLRDVVDKIKKTLPNWSVDFRGDRIEILPPRGIVEAHRLVEEAVRGAIGKGQVVGNIEM
ncbi:hypothetical protein A2482_05075 [Candidatus Falkowbacteria bacterium RIFOXYC2_FULL_48_21]|uniref:Uncharacterized protein n=1 Tax=Candidatus Falkowbacteria bacterium RIFOXYC2_FULL_48_21 TaxID=1798005 RepID=A0A1F5TF57_9BACT|nr:MAG: hypothetical protein A2482_05075 [Candidatus Falkowbacteria bacterium RIFOXYC2_FULL_48_21]